MNAPMLQRELNLSHTATYILVRDVERLIEAVTCGRKGRGVEAIIDQVQQDIAICRDTIRQSEEKLK